MITHCEKAGNNTGSCDEVIFERSKRFLGPRSGSEFDEKLRQFFEFLFFKNDKLVKFLANIHESFTSCSTSSSLSIFAFLMKFDLV